MLNQNRGQSTGEGTILENLTSLYGMKQLISAPTHILKYSSSCIDLTFVKQPSLVINAGIHPSSQQQEKVQYWKT